MKLNSDTHNARWALIPTLVLIVLAVAGTGFRPDYVGSDTLTYLNTFYKLQSNLNTHEIIFIKLMIIFTHFNLSSSSFFTMISAINFTFVALISKKLNNFLCNKVSTHFVFLLLFIFFSVSPFFYASQFNVIRQGTAILSLFFFYISALCRANPLTLLMGALFAVGFHKSSLPYLLFFPLLYTRLSIVIALVLLLGLCYLTGLSEYLVSVLSNALGVPIYKQIHDYGLVTGYCSGRRLDFTLFTLILGFIFHGMANFVLTPKNKFAFKQLLTIYWILAMPFFLLGFAAYADRYLLPAWLYLSVLAAIFLLFIIPKSTLGIRVVYLISIICAMLFYSVSQGVILFN